MNVAINNINFNGEFCAAKTEAEFIAYFKPRFKEKAVFARMDDATQTQWLKDAYALICKAEKSQQKTDVVEVADAVVEDKKGKKA